MTEDLRYPVGEFKMPAEWSANDVAKSQHILGLLPAKLKSAVYPVAKPTYAAGYPGGDPAPAEADTLAPRPDLHP